MHTREVTQNETRCGIAWFLSGASDLRRVVQCAGDAGGTDSGNAHTETDDECTTERDADDWNDLDGQTTTTAPVVRLKLAHPNAGSTEPVDGPMTGTGAAVPGSAAQILRHRRTVTSMRERSGQRRDW